MQDMVFGFWHVQKRGTWFHGQCLQDSIAVSASMFACLQGFGKLEILEQSYEIYILWTQFPFFQTKIQSCTFPWDLFGPMSRYHQLNVGHAGRYRIGKMVTLEQKDFCLVWNLKIKQWCASITLQASSLQGMIMMIWWWLFKYLFTYSFEQRVHNRLLRGLGG